MKPYIVLTLLLLSIIPGSAQQIVDLPVNNGLHTITAIARDVVGNLGYASESILVAPIAESVPPTVTIINWRNGAVFTGNGLDVTVQAVDDIAANVWRVELWVDGKMVNYLGWDALPDSNTLHWRTRSVPKGTHKIEARAFDKSGNRGTTTITLTK